MASVCFFYTTYFRGDWKCISESCTSVLCSTWLTQVLCHYALGAQACLNSRRSEVGWKMQHLDNVIKISELMGWGGGGGGLWMVEGVPYTDKEAINAEHQCHPIRVLILLRNWLK